MSLFSQIQKIYRALTSRKVSKISVQAQEQEKPEEGSRNYLNLYEMYSSCPPLFRAINIRATLASRFLKLNSSNPDKLKRILSYLSPTASMSIIENIVFKASIDSDIFGLGAVELYLNENMRPELSSIHAKSIDFKRDSSNKILFKPGTQIPQAIIQTTDFETTEIDYNDVSLLRYNALGDELYGISLVKLCYSSAEYYTASLKGFGKAMNKLGFPIYDFSIGNETHEPTPEIVDYVKNKVKNFADKKEFIHEYFIKTDVTESKTISQASDFDKTFIRAIAIASGIPEFLLTGNTNDLSLASSKIMSEILPSILLPSLQNPIEIFVEDIFKKLASIMNIDATIDVSFKPIFTIDQLSDARRAEILSKLDICSKEEIRKIAGL